VNIRKKLNIRKKSRNNVVWNDKNSFKGSKKAWHFAGLFAFRNELKTSFFLT